MIPKVFNIGPIMISLLSIFYAFAFFLSSFFIWKGLKEEYQEEDILNFTVILTLGSILGARLFYILFTPRLLFNPLRWLALRIEPGFSFFGALVSFLLITFLWSGKKKWDFWLVFDNLSLPFFFVFSFLSFGLIITNGGELFFYLFFLSVLFSILSIFLAKYYRRFIWYKSGKPGFVGCLSLGFFSMIFGLLEFFLKKGVYFEIIGILLFAFLFLVLFYKRSERSVKEDFKSIFIRKK